MIKLTTAENSLLIDQSENKSIVFANDCIQFRLSLKDDPEFLSILARIKQVFMIAPHLFQPNFTFDQQFYSYDAVPCVTIQHYLLYLSNLHYVPEEIGRIIADGFLLALQRIYDLFSLFHDQNLFYKQLDFSRIGLCLTKIDGTDYMTPVTSYLLSYSQFRYINDYLSNAFFAPTTVCNVHPDYDPPESLYFPHKLNELIRMFYMCTAVDNYQLTVLGYHVISALQRIVHDFPFGLFELAGVKNPSIEVIMSISPENRLTSAQFSSRLQILRNHHRIPHSPTNHEITYLSFSDCCKFQRDCDYEDTYSYEASIQQFILCLNQMLAGAISDAMII